ncbi:hypothetical protein N9W06_03075 [Candidatus Marinimicrobia bacterium]|nr:hypothetical protein [Candidatus Neomarinimicrobiota bacterium]
MEIIIHRVNTIARLKKLRVEFGIEIDVRSSGSNLILNHEPYERGENLIDYLDEYKHGTIIFNIKESGIENDVIKLINQRSNIKNYFLLDVEFPFIFQSLSVPFKNIALRFSEFESIENLKKLVGKVGWVWIDTFKHFPVKEDDIETLNRYKKCLVCPERWGRPNDISKYKMYMKDLNFKIDAVMTAKNYVELWLD